MLRAGLITTQTIPVAFLVTGRLDLRVAAIIIIINSYHIDIVAI
jgi:hypothetical protein